MKKRILKLLEVSTYPPWSEKKLDHHNLFNPRIIMFWVQEPDIKVPEPHIAAYAVKFVVKDLRLGRLFWNKKLWKELDEETILQIEKMSKEGVEEGEFVMYWCEPVEKDYMGDFLIKSGIELEFKD